MLIVTATIPIDPEAAALFTDAATDLVRATRGEVGCLDYVVCVDPIDPSQVRMFEMWQDGAALAAHAKTPHVSAFMERTSAPRTGKTKVRVHAADVLSPEQLRELFSPA